MIQIEYQNWPTCIGVSTDKSKALMMVEEVEIITDHEEESVKYKVVGRHFIVINVTPFIAMAYGIK